MRALTPNPITHPAVFSNKRSSSTAAETPKKNGWWLPNLSLGSLADYGCSFTPSPDRRVLVVTTFMYTTINHRLNDLNIAWGDPSVLQLRLLNCSCWTDLFTWKKTLEFWAWLGQSGQIKKRLPFDMPQAARLPSADCYSIVLAAQHHASSSSFTRQTTRTFTLDAAPTTVYDHDYDYGQDFISPAGSTMGNKETGRVWSRQSAAQSDGRLKDWNLR